MSPEVEALFNFFNDRPMTEENARAYLKAHADYYDKIISVKYEKQRSEMSEDELARDEEYSENRKQLCQIDYGCVIVLLPSVMKRWDGGERGEELADLLLEYFQTKEHIGNDTDEDRFYFTDDEKRIHREARIFFNSQRCPDVQVGTYYEHCCGHPCLCTERDDYKGEVSGRSLVDGIEGYSCSLNLCAPDFLFEEEAQIMAAEKEDREAVIQRHRRIIEQTDEYAPGGKFRKKWMDECPPEKAIRIVSNEKDKMFGPGKTFYISQSSYEEDIEHDAVDYDVVEEGE